MRVTAFYKGCHELPSAPPHGSPRSPPPRPRAPAPRAPASPHRALNPTMSGGASRITAVTHAVATSRRPLGTEICAAE